MYDYNELKTVLIDIETVKRAAHESIKNKDYNDIDDFMTIHFISKKHKKELEKGVIQ